MCVYNTEKEDYAESELIVRFDSSHTTETAAKCLTIPVLHDDILEDTETFITQINKMDTSLGYRLEPFTVLCDIEDNDSELDQLDISRYC